MGKYDILDKEFFSEPQRMAELRQFFRAMQSRYDKHKLAELFEQEEFQSISTQTQKIIAVHLNVRELRKKVIEEGENMCKAYRDLVKDWKQEGRLEGRLEGKSEERIRNLRHLMDNLQLTAKQAMDALQIEESERENCYRMLERY